MTRSGHRTALCWVSGAELCSFSIAGVYLGYAFQDGRVRMVAIEAIGAVMLASCLLAVGYPTAIAVALGVHGLWDLLHHSVIPTDIPRWYIPFCALVDWVVAAGLLIIWASAG